MSNANTYNDPYATPYQGEHFAQQQAAYPDNPSYDQSSQHDTYMAPNQSTEKMLGDTPVQRAQPGRQNLGTAPKSWAEMGPPPRSTGILRMWRKDERGPQWFRGGGLRSGFRLFFCCLIIALITIISIILAIALVSRISPELC